MEQKIHPALLLKLSRQSALRSLFVLAREWAVIIFCFWLVIKFPHPFIFIVCFILLARQSYSLFVLFHEATHGHLFRSKKINDFVGNWICGAPITFILNNFRPYHLRHHDEPLIEADPDYKMVGGYPVTKASLRRKLMRDLMGITNYRGHLLPDYTVAKTSTFLPYIPMIVVNLLMWLGFYSAGHGWYLLLFWMLPGATVAVFFVRIGVISQHGGLKPNKDQSFVARTITSYWQSFWFAPNNLNYHLEHHLYPQVPFFNLPKLHKILKENGALPKNNVHSNYQTVIKEITI